MTPWLTLVGLGEDGLEGLGADARLALETADLVVGGRRHLALVGPTRGEQRSWASPIEATYPLILARRGTPVCVLATGDPFCYGIGSVLARHVPAAEMRCLPKPSAFSLMAARLAWALPDCICLTLHGRPLELILPVLRPGARILALAWDARTPEQVATLLAGRGFGASTIHVGEALGGPRAGLRSARADAFDLAAVDPLATIAIEVAAARDARIPPLTPGLPDGWFEHDGQITKSRIRAVTLAALAPRPGELLWDVGAGSGSVGIEWMLAHPACRAVAVERQPARGARIRRNALTFGVPDLAVVAGQAPDVLSGLPRPDAVFVGGGLTVPGLLAACRDALPPGGRLLANAVTLESQAVLAEARALHGGELCTITLAQAEPVGRFHGWRAAMPVTQWVWIRP